MTEAELFRTRYIEGWVGLADCLDRQLSPLGLGAIEALKAATGQRLLDIGCGTGQTLVQLADRVGAAGAVIGVDILGELLAAAQERTRGISCVRFIESDAALLTLPDESVDGVFSRFGVMAIAQPEAACANFRRMTKRGGRLAFVCWRALEDNELDWLPLQAAGLVHLVDRTPFRFEEASYVRGLLEGAGYREIDIQAQDMAVACGNLDDTVRVLIAVGALGGILRTAPEHRAIAEGKVRAALPAARSDGCVYLGAATWVVSALA